MSSIWSSCQACSASLHSFCPSVLRLYLYSLTLKCTCHVYIVFIIARRERVDAVERSCGNVVADAQGVPLALVSGAIVSPDCQGSGGPMVVITDGGGKHDGGGITDVRKRVRAAVELTAA